MICPDCAGSGKTGLVHLNRGNQPHEWRDGMPCSRCQGAGSVPDEMADWIACGKKAREARIAAGVSIAARARQLGLTSVALSAMEHGRRDPSPLNGDAA